MAIIFFVLSVLGALATLFALAAPRRPAMLGFVGWMFGLVPVELPFVCIGWSVFLLLLFGALGAFDSALGIAGIVLVALSIVGDLVLARRSAAAGAAVDRALRRRARRRLREPDRAVARVRRCDAACRWVRCSSSHSSRSGAT